MGNKIPSFIFEFIRKYRHPEGVTGHVCENGHVFYNNQVPASQKCPYCGYDDVRADIGGPRLLYDFYQGGKVQWIRREIEAPVPDTYQVDSLVTIPGRGTLLLINIRQFPDLPARVYNMGELKPWVEIGKEVYHRNVRYQIRGIEASMALMDPPFLKDGIALQVSRVKDLDPLPGAAELTA